jgi:hypothetical protein
VLRPEQEVVERLPDEQGLDLGHDAIVRSSAAAAARSAACFHAAIL